MELSVNKMSYMIYKAKVIGNADHRDLEPVYLGIAMHSNFRVLCQMARRMARKRKLRGRVKLELGDREVYVNVWDPRTI